MVFLVSSRPICKGALMRKGFSEGFPFHWIQRSVGRFNFRALVDLALSASIEMLGGMLRANGDRRPFGIL